jgi:tetratricopeptide (TPR) repeat protein
VQPGSIAPNPEATAGPAPFELAQLEHFREEAKTIAAKILREQILLEDSGALLWAKDKMASVQNLADAGDLLFRDKDFEGSISSYQQSLSILDELQDSIPEVQSEYLAKGNEALASGDASTAIEAFTIVLSITPNDADAAESFARAQTLEEVLNLLRSAGQLEDAEQFQAALAEYKEAQSIDPLWPAANQGVKRVSGKITTRKFNLAMSQGFSELKQNNFDAARKAFSKAQSLLPDSHQPADGLDQVDLAFRLQKIEQYKKHADQSARQEDWSTAISEYQNALDLDSSLIFANKGLEHARKRLQLADSLNQYINSPLSLNDPAALQDAKQLLYQASMVSDPGKILAKQITAMSKHIKLARVPVEVELQSDKLTDIVVYKVAHLGKIKSTRLELYPGVYTVVGKRKGYRDVRKQITLFAGQDTAPVSVQCFEKI